MARSSESQHSKDCSPVISWWEVKRATTDMARYIKTRTHEAQVFGVANSSGCNVAIINIDTTLSSLIRQAGVQQS